MSLSIITPHYNDYKGLEQIYDQLKNQKSEYWEWIIVDDASCAEVKEKMELIFNSVSDSRIKLIFNSHKTNASLCRNKGAEVSTFKNLVFLDADDQITEEFVKNRGQVVSDFTVYKNMKIIDNQGNETNSSLINSDYLNHFLNTNFVWQTSAVVWNKDFFKIIGGFNVKLQRLQDVEMIIRALATSKNYKIIDNPIDFYYRVSPIRDRKHLVQPVCESVFLLFSELIDRYNFSKGQRYLLRSYYYLCAKYVERSEHRNNTRYLKPLIKLFYNKAYFSFKDKVMAHSILHCYKLGFLSNHWFLKLNRHLYKSNLPST